MAETALVLGGSGFIGLHTANTLSEAGYTVRIFDLQPPEKLAPGQSFIKGDILDAQAVAEAVKGCDYVYHFAGIADIEECNNNPVESTRINIMGTMNVLDAAVKHKIKRVVFASTVYVYSNVGGFYRSAKQACENLIDNYNEQYSLNFTVLRYGSLYGPGAGPTNGIHKLIKSALETGEIVYNGDPEATREYIHVFDAARLTLEILKPEYENRHMILTGQERMKVVDMMRMISEMMPNRPQFRFGEKSLVAHYIMTPYSYVPRLGHKLTLNDRIDLGQGLLDCIAGAYESDKKIKNIA
jgi:UDP-glucose 4-epimerase